VNKTVTFSLATLILLAISSCGDKNERGSAAAPVTVTGGPPSATSACPAGKCESADYEGFLEPTEWGRYSVSVTKAERFTTKPLDMKRLEYLCGDMDGCQIRLGMFNWDNQMRLASREGLFYYNKDTRRWRSSLSNTSAGGPNDVDGMDFDGTTQHVMQSFSCYVTDAEYVNRAESDSRRGFGLLAWDNTWSGDCWVTFID
jgi:hypothetical protein